ncbi:MAG TPA: folylpolyglutamate synthase/dihydrofolate synthase family protein [Oscillospiraceae bacterium]|nr:bifunctional folylpolyglutamate synthase/dihydrofolate synthase [Oscillospiraceae bacterium]HNW04979.1 folylpolyglutamate synthase/dihydrofolate synthase family protein [Oscillospiraceae bacterium]
MDINQSISYLNSIDWRGSRLGLERMAALLARLGNPQSGLRYIHITGTNGKGSTAAMLESICRAAGYKTGLYTSPYINCFAERIRVAGENIPDEALCRLTERVRAASDAMPDHPTTFEMVTALGFLYFAEQACEIVVLEVGMGGELDATNVIPAPEAAVFTNIGLDHMEYLGGTAEVIAATKSKIVKPGCSAVSYQQTPSVRAVLEARCAETGADFTEADFSKLCPTASSLDGQTFDYGEETGVSIALLGEHQRRNAAVALETVGVLRKKGWDLPEEAVRKGMAQARWPARFEILSREPLFILDGGHNPQCMEALAACFEENLGGRKAVFLVGVMADKDWENMFAPIERIASEYVAVEPNNPRRLPARELAAFLSREGKPAAAVPDVREAVALALQKAGAEGVVCAAGSLFMAGEIRSCFGK